VDQVSWQREGCFDIRSSFFSAHTVYTTLSSIFVLGKFFLLCQHELQTRKLEEVIKICFACLIRLC